VAKTEWLSHEGYIQHKEFSFRESAVERLLCGFALQAIRRHFKPLSLYQPLPEAP